MEYGWRMAVHCLSAVRILIGGTVIAFSGAVSRFFVTSTSEYSFRK